MKASMLYRIAAVLLLLFAIAHTLGFRHSEPAWGVDALLGSLRSTHFDVQGFDRTFWDFFVAAGFSVGVPLRANHRRTTPNTHLEGASHA